MKKINYPPLILLVLLVVTGWGCSSSTGTDSEPVEASAQKQFVWNAMNYWYYWQSEVPELADDRFSNDQDFQRYLNGFSSARLLFENLIYEQSDDFSFFIENYETFQQSQQGISESFGFEYGLVRLSNSDDIFGYVQYVLPNSPAEEVGLQRGDLFLEVDGTQMTVNNYQDLLFNTTSYELSLAQIQNNNISLSGETVSLQAETLQENPIFLSSIINTGSANVGYLVYNAFQTNSHQELNDIFGNFQSQGIDELVLDLRYNGGGSGLTSQILSSLISGEDSTNVFAEYAFNEKRAPNNNTTVNFWEEVPILDDQGNVESTEPMNSLGLDRVYVLADFGTASASEVLINGLEPYMEVVLIGGQTTGKDEGSYTLYDAPAPYLNEQQANPDHKIAIQPIIIKVVNVNGRDYPDGFLPDYEVNELESLSEGLPPLGDTEDPLLAQALQLISNQTMARIAPETPANFYHKRILKDSRDLQPYSKGLYLDAIEVGAPAAN